MMPSRAVRRITNSCVPQQVLVPTEWLSVPSSQARPVPAQPSKVTARLRAVPMH